MKVYAQQQDTVDMLCLRQYGQTQGATEAVLSANPGLADVGVFLPQGWAVEMPDTVAPVTHDTIQLWD